MSATAPPPTAERDTGLEPERRPPRARVAARHTWRALGVTGSWIISKIPELVLQSVLIVFSIVLGLAVNKRIEERSERQTKVELLSRFEREIGQNLAFLQADLQNHTRLRAAMMKMDSAGQLRTAEEFYDLLGVADFRPTPLVTTTWQTAVSTGTMALLDSTAYALSLTYTKQTEYERASESRMPDFLRTGTAAPGGPRAMVRAAQRYMDDQARGEQMLQAIYEEALARVAAARRAQGG